MAHSYPADCIFKSIEDIKDKHVTIMGLGLNGGGEAAVRFFLKKGAYVLVTDKKTQAQLLQYLDTLECPARIYEQRIYSRYYVVPENYLRGADKEKGFFAKFQTLNSLGEYFGTDKCNKGHDYLRKYELFLQYWKDKKFTLLELGVFRGESLFTWGGSGDREGYFNEASLCCSRTSNTNEWL